MDIWNSNSTVYKIFKGLFAVGLITFIAASCTETNTSGPQLQEKARMNVYLTDAPANYQEVNIDLQGLRIHYTPASSDTADSNSEDGEWIDLSIEPMTVNLLELQNGVDTLLASTELEAGHYQELRLMLGENNNVVIDSTTHNLKVPSGQQSGYKIKFKTELEEGEELDVTIDFDASRSVHKAGNSGKYILNPVLKAFVEEGDDVQTGSITGIVEPSEANPSIIAMMEEDTAATTQPDTTGSFLLEGLEVGNYELSFEPENESYMDSTLNNVPVEAGEETDVGTITLEESS